MNTTTKPRFTTPILSVFYIIIGSVLLIAGGLMLFASGGKMPAVAIGTGVALAGLINFGIAQVITAICETAFNTRKS